MIERFDIAGYTRISVDDELDRDNVSIENQKAIIADFVKERFPHSTLTFYEDRDRSGYTFEQREDYQRMRKELMRHKYDILIVKDFSRFSRRNSRGLVELEDLRDAGIRIISDVAFSASALPYAQEAMDVTVGPLQRHSGDLKADDKTYLCFDLEQMGLGCINSWGRLPLDEYLVEYKDYTFNFIISPVR